MVRGRGLRIYTGKRKMISAAVLARDISALFQFGSQSVLNYSIMAELLWLLPGWQWAEASGDYRKSIQF